jgi:hypothetical protein
MAVFPGGGSSDIQQQIPGTARASGGRPGGTFDTGFPARNNQNNGGNAEKLDSAATVMSAPLNTSSAGGTIPVDPRLVFLTVNNNEHHQLAQIKAHILEDDSFFEALKQEYVQKRGTLRMILSIWRYAGCEFRRASMAVALRDHNTNAMVCR